MLKPSQCFKTDDVLPGIREQIPNGMQPFDRCERCGHDQTKCEKKDEWMNVVFRSRYGLVLCDRCTDQLDGTWRAK